MADAEVALHETDVDIDPMIYGQYFEHVEDCVDPGLVDDAGAREDVIDCARELGVPIVRWPGGCFADIYDWRDGIGPVASRPVRRNWHWGNDEIERNRFGTAEYLQWCESVGAAPYINVNFGSSTLLEQLSWLDYCNGDRPTADVELRKRNGRTEPWNVRYWGIGNETWARSEAGHMASADYGRALRTWASFFRRYDKDLMLIGVGSDAGSDREWDRTVLEEAGDSIDFLSIHLYGSTPVPDSREDLDAAAYGPAYIEARLKAFVDLVAGYNTETGRTVRVAVDEWNRRHYRAKEGQDRAEGSAGYELRRASPRNGGDVLFAAGVFHAMIRHAELVGLANYVFLVNGHGVIDARDGHAEPSALYPLFRAYHREMVGTRIDVNVRCTTRRPPAVRAGHPSSVVDPDELPEQLDEIDAVACRGDDKTSVALINRSADATDVHLDGGLAGWSTVFETWVEPDDMSAGTREDHGEWNGRLRPHSVTIISRPTPTG